jgi:hypothetical protein
MMAADQPMCTPATPKAVRDLELEAMRLYRTNFQAATPWHELADTTRLMWVEHAEKERGTSGVGGNDGR